MVNVFITQNDLKMLQIFSYLKAHLTLNDTEFGRYREKIEKYIYRDFVELTDVITTFP
jgi:hypothetical protein